MPDNTMDEMMSAADQKDMECGMGEKDMMYEQHCTRPSPAGHVSPGSVGKFQTDIFQAGQDGSKPQHVRDVKTDGKQLSNPALAGTKVRIPPPFEVDRV